MANHYCPGCGVVQGTNSNLCAHCQAVLDKALRKR